MKRTEGTVKRFSPDWIRMIPRSLARGIWNTIEEGLGGKEHAKIHESRRRKRQIESGRIGQSGRGVVEITTGALCEHDKRLAERAEQTRELQRARAERVSKLSAVDGDTAACSAAEPGECADVRVERVGDTRDDGVRNGVDGGDDQ